MNAGTTIRKTLLASLCIAVGAVPAWAECFRGVNLAGAEFGDLGGAYGQTYIYPSSETINYFAGKGLNTIRLPFRWERLQPIPGSAFDRDELQRLEDTIANARAEKQTVILDVHNYANFAGAMIGSNGPTIAEFADLWSRLAEVFANRPGIAFGLMNEPNGIDTGLWLKAVNAAIAAMREKDAKNLVLVPGTSWTGAHSWFSTTGDGNNAATMIGVQDPADNFAFEFHQYLDSNFSGTHDDCPRAGDALEALQKVTDWLEKTGNRGFLGEFGGSGQPACLQGLADMVDYLNARKDIWTGWTYWAGGDWWPESEPLNIQPHDGKDRPQLSAILRPGLRDTACAVE